MVRAPIDNADHLQWLGELVGERSKLPKQIGQRRFVAIHWNNYRVHVRQKLSASVQVVKCAAAHLDLRPHAMSQSNPELPVSATRCGTLSATCPTCPTCPFITHHTGRGGDSARARYPPYRGESTLLE